MQLRRYRFRASVSRLRVTYSRGPLPFLPSGQNGLSPGLTSSVVLPHAGDAPAVSSATIEAANARTRVLRRLRMSFPHLLRTLWTEPVCRGARRSLRAGAHLCVNADSRYCRGQTRTIQAGGGFRSASDSGPPIAQVDLGGEDVR